MTKAVDSVDYMMLYKFEQSKPIGTRHKWRSTLIYIFDTNKQLSWVHWHTSSIVGYHLGNFLPHPGANYDPDNQI